MNTAVLIDAIVRQTTVLIASLATASAGTEIWRDWCALQMPYPSCFEGTSGYRCVPQDATRDNTDYGKFLLCTSAYAEGVCSYEDPPWPPNPEPCLCATDAGSRDPRAS